MQMKKERAMGGGGVKSEKICMGMVHSNGVVV